MIKGIFLVSFVLVLVVCEVAAIAQAAVVAGESESVPSAAENEQLEKDAAAIERRMGMTPLSQTWTGDLDVMAEKRIIRVLTVYGLGRYFLDGPQEKGLTITP